MNAQFKRSIISLVLLTALIILMSILYVQSEVEIGELKTVALEKKKAIEVLAESKAELKDTLAMVDQRNADLKDELQVGKDLIKDQQATLKDQRTEINTQKQKIDTQKQEIDVLLNKKKQEAEAQSTAQVVSRGGNRTVQTATSPKSSSLSGASITMEATAYTAKCNGCSGITKTGIDVRHTTPNIIAVDPTVIPLGSKVEVFIDGKSMGVYLAADTGGDIKGRRIDILMPTKEQAYKFGRQNVSIVIKK